jgi:hypothetical protein
MRSRRSRTAWPSPPDVAEFLLPYRVIVSVDTAGCVRSEILDGLAAGLFAVVTMHPGDETEDGWSSIVDNLGDLPRSDGPETTVRVVRRFLSRSDDDADRRERVRATVLARHTWRHRVSEVLGAFEDGG